MIEEIITTIFGGLLGSTITYLYINNNKIVAIDNECLPGFNEFYFDFNKEDIKDASLIDL